MGERAALDQIKAILDESRACEDCDCRNCTDIKTKAAETYECNRCGYRGQPATAACACYDTSCHGGNQSGAGCSHGYTMCPSCDDGEGDTDPWEIIKRIRTAIA